MNWIVVIARSAEKTLSRVSAVDKKRLLSALREMEANPYAGDVRPIKDSESLRRRVGNWRIFFDLDKHKHIVFVSAIRRRDSKTYTR